MTEIIKGKLYLGDIHNANDFDFLNTMKIDSIITVANYCDVSKVIKNTKKVYKYDISDDFNEDIMQYFTELTNLIERENCVLVHCIAGISRSPTITIAYLMTKYNITLLEAFKLVKGKRPMIKPNHSFIKQLLTYEIVLYGKNSVSATGFEYKKELFYDWDYNKL
jgi:protein-tyrosine phosphatase